jgi:hypothetical protein
MIPTTYSSQPFRYHAIVQWPGPLDVALGHKRTLKRVHPMSALPPKADMVRHVAVVRERTTAWWEGDRVPDAQPCKRLPCRRQNAISSFVLVSRALVAVAAVKREPKAFAVSGAPCRSSPTPAYYVVGDLRIVLAHIVPPSIDDSLRTEVGSAARIDKYQETRTASVKEWIFFGAKFLALSPSYRQCSQ